MSPLSSQINLYKYLLIWSFLACHGYLLANNSHPKHIKDSIPRESFLDDCKNSDAYYLYTYTDMSYSKYLSGYLRHVSISNKLVINTTKGVEQFAFLSLDEYISNHLKTIQVKTHKADGTIVALDSSLVFKKSSKKHKFGPINYPIPGVEPGDTIVTSYTYTKHLKSYEMMDFVDLYNHIPNHNSEYTVRTNPELLVHYKRYNNFPEPQVVTNDTLIYCVFKMEKVVGIPNNPNTCTTCELPYVYYSIEKEDTKERTWKDVYNEEFNVMSQPMALDTEKSSYYRTWKRRVIGEAKDSTKYHKFGLLHQDILNNITMEPVDPGEVFKSNGYFLKEQRFNTMGITRLYRQILEDLEIEYSAIFARSKRAGAIDPYYIRKGEYDHIFFAYDNGSGGINLLYPHDVHYKYQINEIPTSLYNTLAIAAKPYLPKKIKQKDKFIGLDLKLAEVDSVSIGTITLPGMSENHNQIKQIYYGNLDPEQKTSDFSYRFLATGGLFTDLRSFFSLLEQDEQLNNFYSTLNEFEGTETGIQIDSIISTELKGKKPFAYTLNAKGTVKDGVQFLNDSIVSISLGKFIQHNLIENDDTPIDLNYYLDYSYSTDIMILLDFPCNIELLGDSNQINLKNDVAAYYYDMKLVAENKLSIQSIYKITKDLIPKEEHDKLEEANELVNEIMNKRIIIKLKKHSTS